jgi:hypothetical protein
VIACTACGACCASFRVDFHRSELEANGGRVPDGLAEPLGGSLFRLRGTDHASPRCAALRGRIGASVACAIYAERPAPCRELEADSPACARARARFGLVA